MLSLRDAYYGLAIAIMCGWLLAVGKSIILPILIAILIIYILSSSTKALAQLPILRSAPMWLLSVLVVVGFLLLFVLLDLMISTNIQKVESILPTYQANLNKVFHSTLTMIGQNNTTTLDDAINFINSRIHLQDVLQSLIGTITNFGSSLFIIVLYCGFLLAERGQFDDKLIAAFASPEKAQKTQALINRINRGIGDYLAVKTLINMILSLISLAIMLFMGIDFAVFWAIFIGLFNYIPYVGSFIGVFFPVLLSVGQFGSLQATALAAFLLIGAQIYVGNIIEPRMIGRRVNLSPFVVMLSLTLWSALWGIAGAIMAVPLTVMLVIIFDNIDSTRGFVKLLADGVETDNQIKSS